MAQKKRIFLASPMDLDSHTCHKTTKLRQTDTVYLVTDSSEDDELSEPVQEFLAGKQVFVHTDDLAGFLRDRCSGKENIYFIGEHMEPVYEEISSELLNYCDGVGKNQTFGVRNVKLKKLEQQTVDDFLINNITDAICDNTSIAAVNPEQPDQAEGRTEDTNAGKQDILREEGTPEKRVYKGKNTAESPTLKKEETVIDRKNLPVPKPRKEYGRKTSALPRKDSKGRSETKPESEIDLNALFEGGGSPDKNTSDAKAGLMAALLERVHRHIEAVLVQKISDEQYFQLMLILMKSESLEEVCESWQCLQPNIPLKITTGEFSALKSEAVYYGKVSDMLYGEDLWNY